MKSFYTLPYNFVIDNQKSEIKLKIMAKEEMEDALDPQETLEALEDMVKEKFKDLLVSMSISAQGALFLHIWQQPSDWYGGQPEFVLEYLPLFHIVGTVSEATHLQLKLITYHGKVIDEQKSTNPSDEQKFNFVKKLQVSKLCQGVSIPESDFRLDVQTFSNLYLVEQFEEKVVLRSRSCHFAIFNQDNSVCKSCSELLYGQNIENGKDTKITNAIKVEPDLWDYTNAENIGNFSQDFIVDSEDDMLDNQVPKIKDNRDDDPSYFPTKKAEKSRSKENVDGEDSASYKYSFRNRSSMQCFICGEHMKGKVLRRHLWSKHLQLKPFKCKHCEFTSISQFRIYNQHYKKEHANGDNNTGTFDDVEPVLEAVQAIEDFERKNKLNLGPSLLEKPVMKKRKLLKTENDDYTDINHLKVEADDDDIDDPNSLDDFNNTGVQLSGIRKRKNNDRGGEKANIECLICLGLFSSKQSFEEDQRKHAEFLDINGKEQCPTCNVSFDKLEMNIHFKNDHAELNAGCCLYCRGVMGRKTLRSHIRKKHWTKNQLCNICGKSFNAASMKDHQEVFHGDKSKNVICIHCGKKFSHQFRLTSHVSKMHSAKKDLPCKFCGQMFHDKTHVRAHTWAMHIKVKPYKCKHCHFQGTQPNRVYSHCRSVHKFKGTKADVENVPSEFARIHEFETQHGLNRKEVKAATEYKCWLCKRDFVKNQSLMQHEFGHLNLSPYECDHCDRKFKKNALLNNHLDKSHNDKRPADSIKPNPGVMALYHRVRKINNKLVEVYEEYKDMKPTVVENTNGCKTVNTISCKKCVNGSSANIAAFLDHFHNSHGHEFSNLIEEINITMEEVVPVELEKFKCKVCGFETPNVNLLDKHIAEVHRFTPAMYEGYIEAPKVEPMPKIFTPRKYRCRYCLVYTAVKKFTVHRHIKNTHGIQESHESNILLISESDHLLQNLEQHQIIRPDQSFNDQ